MVESPRIRIVYENVKFTEGKHIVAANGASYKKIGINLVGFCIKKWWFAGKYLYALVIFDNITYVIRTHMMMYGRIIINKETEVNPRLIPFLILDLSDGTNLTWYLSQIKILDPNCETDEIKSNYHICSSKSSIKDSIIMQSYDLSNPKFDPELYAKHLNLGIKKNSTEIITDFLLNQAYFPGVGNILQQEALYRCRILPIRLVSTLSKVDFDCLVTELQNIIDTLYQLYKRKVEYKSVYPVFTIYHKNLCSLGHKTTTKYIGDRNRKTTWCPVCQI